MTCCDCNETSEQRYARWDREKAQSKAAALANPDTWIQVSAVVEDAGDIGGDRQAGPAWSKRFVRWMPSVRKWAVINDAYYAAHDCDNPIASDEAAGIERQTEYMVVRDLNEAGDIEEWADYAYEDVNTEPTRSDYDTYAKELAADSDAADYPDPLTHRDAAVWAS